MSLVGTRPPTLDEWEKYELHHRARLAIKPGITGMWQVSGRSTCVEKAFEIWEQTKEQKSTQLIFCDLSTPKGDGTFNVYEDIRNKLIEKGVPPEEIAFIHETLSELAESMKRRLLMRRSRLWQQEILTSRRRWTLIFKFQN